MMSEILFENKLTIEEINHTAETINITVKSKEKGSFCSKCGTYSNNPHSKYIRKVLDMPMIDKKTIVFIISRRFYCKNSECVQVAFSEQFDDIVGKYNRKTGRLTNYLVKFSLSQSANSLTRLFKELIPISSSTFLRIAHNHKIEPNYTSTTIGLDDFSFKRGVTFGTLVCDLATNKPIDLIESRAPEPVSNHLKNYTNANLVSRDRSTTYASAINATLPNAIHVADRFHVIHNLMEASSDFLKTYIGKGVKFDIVDTNKIQFNDEIVLSNSKLNKVHIIDKVKELNKNGMAIRQICREVDLSRNTVRKYINLDDLENTYSIAHLKKYDLYHNEIIKLLKLGKTYSQIATEFKEKGLSYSYSSIAKYCNSIKKKNDGEIKDIKAKKLISRYTFLKYFWDSKKITTLKEIELLDESLVKYPHLNEIKVAISGFSEIFKNRSVILLNEWLNYHENSSIKQIKSFVNGVRKDYQSVKNCVIYSYNNGVLEGNVNRLKMIKRTIYGRASFHLLRQKVLFNIN